MALITPLTGQNASFKLPLAGKPEIPRLPLSSKPGSLAGPAATPTAKNDIHAKARATAVDFESVFLSQMFSQMFSGMDGEGPVGGAGGAGVWRSFLTDEYAKSFAKAGGIGIADHVYRSLIAQQEARAA
jgi:peptidoglycan hydrolase FlgJ